jgi:hypothetical protein
VKRLKLLIWLAYHPYLLIDGHGGALKSMITLPSLILGMAENPINGHIVATCYNNAIYMINPHMNTMTLIAGQPGRTGDVDGPATAPPPSSPSSSGTTVATITSSQTSRNDNIASIREPRGVCFNNQGC